MMLYFEEDARELKTAAVSVIINLGEAYIADDIKGKSSASTSASPCDIMCSVCFHD